MVGKGNESSHCYKMKASQKFITFKDFLIINSNQNIYGVS